MVGFRTSPGKDLFFGHAHLQIPSGGDRTWRITLEDGWTLNRGCFLVVSLRHPPWLWKPACLVAVRGPFSQ